MKRNKIIGLKKRSVKRGAIVLVAFALFAIFLAFNILRLDLLNYDYYKNKAFDQITTTSTLRAERGNIYDSNMNLLATTETTWRIFVSPKQIRLKTSSGGIDYIEVVCSGLSEILGISKDSLINKIRNSNVLDLTVEKSATKEQYESIISLISEQGLDELIFTEAQSSRTYPSGTLAAHVLGFTGSDNQGLYGLEYYYDSILSGTNGYYLYAKDAGGAAMPGEYTSYVPATDGYSLVTTIDSYIQSELESQLETIRINHGVQNRVTGIVMDTKTGAILAMATSSPFDPNSPYDLDSVSLQKLESSGLTPGSDEYKALKTELMQIMWSNKAVSETYEPGSTFKIVTVAAALDLGVADMNDTFSCNGYHTVGGWRIKCHKVTGHGSGFNLAYGLQMSCNPTMMTLAERIGAENFYNYVEKFGYFKKTGIDLPSEAGTIFHKLENIGSTELATISFGQRFKVSILSQLTAIAAIANGGKLVEPYVVQRVVSSDGTVISEHQTVIKGQVVSEEVCKEIAEVLEAGVSGEGGAKNARVDGYLIAAKTGTSQKFDVLDENGNSYLRIGSTVAFAPSNESGIAVIIVVDEPTSQVKYGSVVAAPYVSAFLEKVLPYLEYESSVQKSNYTVENYTGMNVNTVTNTLKNANINYRVIGNGSVVISQIPESNVDITPELSIIYLYTEEVSSQRIVVPDFSGLSASQANALAVSAGLNLKINGIKDTDSSVTAVSNQSIPPGTSVEYGTVIAIYLIYMDFQD